MILNTLFFGSQRPILALLSSVAAMAIWLMPLSVMAQEAPVGHAARDIQRGPDLQEALAHPSFAGNYASEHNQKCGTLLATPSLLRSPKSRALGSPNTQQNQLLQTLESPSGKFTLHYALSGSDAVPATDEDQNGLPDYVEAAALAADSSYKKMVLELGYNDPIPVGETYRIDFENMGFYGYTYPSSDPAGTSISV
ncbi:MAG: hypothetical protein O2991_04165, partial [Bacteroidetes bacterium]|nr:hypothetical protein [Bacteroidota bacterium]